jgi:hypothetical protein
MRLQLPTPATSEPPRSELGGVAPRRTGRSEAQSAIPAKESDFSSHLKQQRSEDAAIDQARTAPRIESDSTRQTSGSTSDDPTQSESAVPADDSQ